MKTRPGRLHGWQVLTAAIVGAALSPATLVNVPFSLFIAPLEAEFRWTRPTTTAALSVFLALLVVSLPIAGRLVDRFGPRQVVLPSVLGYGLALGSLAFVPASPLRFYLHYGAIAVLGAGAQSLTFVRALSSWFDRRRGLAIGACMAGYGVGYVIVPAVAQALIERFGWRGGYAGLGALAVFGAWPTIALLFRDGPEASQPTQGAGGIKTAAVPNSSVASPLSVAVRSREFWLLAVTFVLMSAALNGVQGQFVPLVTDRGLGLASATLMLSAIGLGSFPGRLAVGFLLDRVFAPVIAISCFSLAALALWWLAEGGSPAGIAVAAVVIGLSLGAENDILGYLTGRYFDLRCFGRIYGLLLAAYLLGAAAGPYTMARVYAGAGSYAPALRAGAVAISLACALLLFLRRYPLGGQADAGPD